MKRKAVRRVTADKKILLHQLAEILCSFLPLDSNSKNAVTFRSIFAESSVEKYIDGYEVKLQALEQGFTNVYQYHQRLLQRLIRKIIPAAINYRAYKRRPLTQKELEDLSDTLCKLGIDMRTEIAKIEIDETLPRITVPPEQLKNHLRTYDLDQRISSEPLQMFSDGHFNESVRKATERFEDYVREITTLKSSGRDLMANAFKDGNYINISNVQPENQTDFIDGYKFLSMGAMASIRNIFSHGDEERRSPEECFEMLLFINWLFRCLKNPEESQLR